MLTYIVVKQIFYYANISFTDHICMPETLNHNSPEYRQYIDSPEWLLKRAQARGRAGHACVACHKKGELDVHHKTYERFKQELPDDLVALCRACHDELHHEWASYKESGRFREVNLNEFTENFIRSKYTRAAEIKTAFSIENPAVGTPAIVTKTDPFKTSKHVANILISTILILGLLWVALTVAGMDAFATLHLWMLAAIAGAGIGLIGIFISLPIWINRAKRENEQNAKEQAQEHLS